MIQIKIDFKTINFHFTYAENRVEKDLLWENHCHALFEMIAVAEGDISVTLEGRNYRMTKNQTILIPPLCYHTVAANTSGTYRRITAFFERSASPSFLQSALAQMNTIPFLCSASWMNDFCSIFSDTPTLYYEPLAESLMVYLFYKLIQNSDTNDTEGNRNHFIGQIISYIDEHLLDRITLDDLAKHTARSKSLVCHQFEEQMGTSPRQYILQKRLAYAQMRLLEGHSATSVAAELGYKSYASFWRIYQKHYGMNPLKTKSIK